MYEYVNTYTRAVAHDNNILTVEDRLTLIPDYSITCELHVM